jgi:pimeloyl-ACP methyl ester carboxylesterase
VKPFYFGANDQRLFGVFHAPESRRAGAEGVVLCNPAFPEYTAAHRALRQLAVLLARSGSPVLRFDYFATGDSRGRSDEADLGHWRRDVLTAVDELKAISGVTRVSLVGLRLGATIAAEVSHQRHEIKTLVLWDPVVLGRTYLAAITRQHLRENPARGRNRCDAACEGLLGYPLPDALRAVIERLDLTAVSHFGWSRVVLITSSQSTEYDALLEHLRTQGVPVEHYHDAAHPPWTEDIAGRQLVPATVLQTIVRHVG